MEAAHPHCREYVLPDFILLLFHLTSSHTSGSESSSFYIPTSNPVLDTPPVWMMTMMMVMMVRLKTYYEPHYAQGLINITPHNNLMNEVLLLSSLNSGGN